MLRFFWCAGILVGDKCSFLRGKTSSFSLGKKKQKPERHARLGKSPHSPISGAAAHDLVMLAIIATGLGRRALSRPEPGLRDLPALRYVAGLRLPDLGCGEGIIGTRLRKSAAYHRDRLKVVRAEVPANPVVAVYWNYYYSYFLLRKGAPPEGQSMPRGWAESTSAEVGGRWARRPPAREGG